MITDWRKLFDSIRVNWVDRNRNIPPGNIGIRCPWCGQNDPSFHMSVSESKPAYRCMRSPQRHSGLNPAFLIQALGFSRTDAVRLLNEFKTNAPAAERETITRAPGEMQKIWDRFLPAAENQECLDYLYTKRGFPDPVTVCDRYDLRYSPAGQWAKRVLFPVTRENEVISWSGRAIRPTDGLRYNMPTMTHTDLLYIPRPIELINVFVEGPMDALKVAVATESHGISVVGLLGLSLSPAKLLRLRSIMRDSRCMLVSVDSTVNVADISLLTAELCQNLAASRSKKGLAAFANRYIIRLPMAPGFDDPGEMPLDIIPGWIMDKVAT
jgi:hypothetical protein